MAAPPRTPAGPAASTLRPGRAARPRFRILGPLGATVEDERRLDLGGPKQRQLLAMLLIHINQVVPTGRLVDALWGPVSSGRLDVTLRSHGSGTTTAGAASGASCSTRPSWTRRERPARRCAPDVRSPRCRAPGPRTTRYVASCSTPGSGSRPDRCSAPTGACPPSPDAWAWATPTSDAARWLSCWPTGAASPTPTHATSTSTTTRR
jgi:hypothetical protein